MRALRLFVAIFLGAALTLTGCHASDKSTTGGVTSAGATDCPTSNTKAFAKTKFVVHVGLAAGTFHRWIYKPFKAGTFKTGAHGRVRAIIKAGVTALFVVHEIKKATDDVKASPLLCKVLIAPLSALAAKFSGLKSKLTHGDTSSLDGIQSGLSNVTSLSSANGAPIRELTDQSQR